jgi:hypothetical protein
MTGCTQEIGHLQSINFDNTGLSQSQCTVHVYFFMTTFCIDFFEFYLSMGSSKGYLQLRGLVPIFFQSTVSVFIEKSSFVGL